MVWCTKALSEFPYNSWKNGNIDSLLKRIRKTGIPLSGNQAAVDHVHHVAVEDLVLSQEDKPKRRVRWEIRLASVYNSWARRHLKHLSWRSRWIILCTLQQRTAVSCEISRADWRLFSLSTWLSTRSSTATRRMWSTAAWLPDNGTRLVDSLIKQTVDASNFPTIVRKFTQRPSCTMPFYDFV